MILPALAAFSLVAAAPSPPPVGPVLFICAHPDDEIIVAPPFYPKLPADALAAHPPRMIAWSGVDRALLTTTVAFAAADAAASRTAALCHHSQFASPAIVDALIADLEPVMAGAIHLRPARALSGDPFQ